LAAATKEEDGAGNVVDGLEDEPDRIEDFEITATSEPPQLTKKQATAGRTSRANRWIMRCG
jgi:hypothetical protein